jgi:hypothetical protein
VSADTALYEDDFMPETADPTDLGDPAARRQARREAVERDRSREQDSHQDSVKDFVREPKRSRSAKEYENKAADVLRFAMRMTVTSDSTVADAAAILTYGEQVAEKIGDLAAEDARVAKIIDFINGGTDSPYLNLAMVSLPLVLQVIRNHEPDTVAEVKKEIRLFKRWTIKVPFRIRLRNKALRSLTSDPKELYSATFTPEVVEALTKQGVSVPAYKG